jgi:predicted nucleic acid-binding protein
LIIVDSTVWIDFLRNRDTLQTEWLSRFLLKARFGLTDLILTEVLQGIRDEKVANQVSRELQEYDVFAGGGAEIAVASAEYYRTLRRKGITVRKTIDCLIATFCIRNGHSLLHNDSDFVHFETHFGLDVIHPRPN